MRGRSTVISYAHKHNCTHATHTHRKGNNSKHPYMPSPSPVLEQRIREFDETSQLRRSTGFLWRKQRGENWRDKTGEVTKCNAGRMVVGMKGRDQQCTCKNLCFSLDFLFIWFLILILFCFQFSCSYRAGLSSFSPVFIFILVFIRFNISFYLLIIIWGIFARGKI